jgi:ribosomal protein L22
MSPAPRKRAPKSTDKPEQVEGETPDAAEDAEQGAAKPKPKRARKPRAKAAAPEPVAESAPPAEPEPEPAPKTTPAAEPDEEPAKTQGDKAAEEELAPPGDEQPAPAAAKPRRARRAKADETSAEPAPGPKRPARDPDAGPPLVRAHAKYVRTSARKARLVCDHIRGKSVQEARAILAHANRDVARDWTKLLESAVANAEHNHELVGDELRIHAVKADEGPTLKRFRPRAMGRATPIRKRTSHLSITLTPKDGDY